MVTWQQTWVRLPQPVEAFSRNKQLMVEEVLNYTEIAWGGQGVCHWRSVRMTSKNSAVKLILCESRMMEQMTARGPFPGISWSQQSCNNMNFGVRNFTPQLCALEWKSDR